MHELLWCTPRIPYPATDGGSQAMYYPMSMLAKEDYAVTLLTFGIQNTPVVAMLQQEMKVELVDHDTRNKPVHALTNLTQSSPYTANKYYARVCDEARRADPAERF